MSWPKNPTVFEINTWVWLQELSLKTDCRVTLGAVPDSELERLAGYGFDAIWLMGVWQRSARGLEVAREHSELRQEYRRALPDFTPIDVVGSPYAILGYRVDERLGGDEELNSLRERLRQFDLRLILDFIPNHLARDHCWVTDHPERLVQGTQDNLLRNPNGYFAMRGRVFAHGRDPNLAPWNDTVQVDFRHADTRSAMTEYLLAVASRCDGVRCDMAMLVLHDVFLYTWGGNFDQHGVEFWSEAIQIVKAANKNVVLLAEVYWDLAFELQQMGFDYAYDKGLYDELLGDFAADARIRLHRNADYQSHLMRFIENHDEKRAVVAFGDSRRSRTIGTLTLTLPGMRLLHDGQLEGNRRRVPVQLARRPLETTDAEMEQFYQRLLLALRHPVFHEGDWRLLKPEITGSHDTGRDSLVAFQWMLADERRLVVVNLSSKETECLLPLEMPGIAGHSWRLRDSLGGTEYVRSGDDLLSRGFHLKISEYGYHVFCLELCEETLLSRPGAGSGNSDP